MLNIVLTAKVIPIEKAGYHSLSSRHYRQGQNHSKVEEREDTMETARKRILA
jgi:hypothetical protein